MKTEVNKSIFRFDGFTVDTENFEVHRNRRAITLAPRAFDVLVLLLSHAGRVVEKQELFDAVWKDTFVTDNALTKVIKELRQALGDSADAPRYIETVPKRGYRFIGCFDPADEPLGVDASAAPGPAGNRRSLASPLFIVSAVAIIALAAAGIWLWTRRAPAPSEQAGIRSIAVLPFKPISTESRDESLEMGMAETLITRLSNLRQVAVRPISAVRKFTDPAVDAVAAGHELQAEAVLEGSIQKAGERIRITVRLVGVKDGNALWSEQFDENFTDIFAVQDSIAQRVAGALALQLSKQERDQIVKHYTDNPEAYQIYLKGQLIWNRRSRDWIEQSLSAYQQALEKDPNFALAYIGVADCYIMMSGHRRIGMKEAEDKARPAILRALEIDGTLAQAHNALAELLYQYDYDWPGAAEEFKKAIDLNPNIAWIHQAYGWYLMSDGHFDEARVEMDRARELDPSSLTINVGRGRLLYFSRQYDEAIRHFQNILAAEPNDRSALLSLYDAYERKGMYAKAVETFIKLYIDDPKLADEFRTAFKMGGWETFLRRQADEISENTEHTGRELPTDMANIYARLGDKEKAFFWLDKVFDRREPLILQFKVEPAYDVLRNDPRYADLLRRIGQQP